MYKNEIKILKENTENIYQTIEKVKDIQTVVEKNETIVYSNNLNDDINNFEEDEFMNFN